MRYAVFILSRLLASAQSRKELNNGEAFAKLCGYIRYFHPFDEAVSLDVPKQ
ncbi:hypothetical protein [Niabella aquatica]